MPELEMPVLITLFILAGSVAGYMAGLLMRHIKFMLLSQPL